MKYHERFDNKEVNNVIKKKLQKMILQVVDFHGVADEDKFKKMLQFKGHQGLKQSDYRKFLGTLKQLIMENDRLWKSDSSIEKAWDILIERILNSLSDTSSGK
jgi:hypothetical protein